MHTKVLAKDVQAHLGWCQQRATANNEQITTHAIKACSRTQAQAAGAIDVVTGEGAYTDDTCRATIEAVGNKGKAGFGPVSRHTLVQACGDAGECIVCLCLHSQTVPHAFCCTQKSKRRQGQPAVPQAKALAGLCADRRWLHMQEYFSGRMRTQLRSQSEPREGVGEPRRYMGASGKRLTGRGSMSWSQRRGQVNTWRLSRLAARVHEVAALAHPHRPQLIGRPQLRCHAGTHVVL